MRAGTVQSLENMVLVAASRFGVDAKTAAAIATAAVELMIAQHGGTKLYIPIYEIARRARDEAICDMLDAKRPVALVAKRHRLSKVRIRQIWDARKQNGVDD